MLREESVHTRDDAGLVEHVHGLSGPNASLLTGDDEILRMVLPALRADYRPAETYRYVPGPPLHCPVIALRGDEDPMASLEETRAWSRHTTASFALKSFPGGHFFLNDHIPEILRMVSGHLDGVPQRT